MQVKNNKSNIHNNFSLTRQKSIKTKLNKELTSVFCAHT